MDNNDQFYAPETLENLTTIVEDHSEVARSLAIESIVKSNEKDKARLLIDVFHYNTWRETQGALLRAIGETGEPRGVEFLIRFIRETKDLPLASNAALGLGHSQTSLAGEFLLSLLHEKESRLRQEAIVGLALMPHFYCDDQLLEIIEDPFSSDTLKLFAIIAAGRRGARDTQGAIANIAKHEKGKLFNASVLALGHLATEEELCKSFSQDTAYQLFAEELKLYARDRCHMRAQRTIEDLVLGVLSDESLDWCTGFRLLREYPKAEVWQTIKIIDDNLDTHRECLLRCATYSESRVDEDIEFLICNQDSIERSEAAILARLCFANKGDGFITNLYPINACRLLEQVHTPSILDLAHNYYGEDTDLSIAYINALVAQSLMRFRPNTMLSEFLLNRLSTETRVVVLERIMRGLAQMGCRDLAFMEKLASNLSEGVSVSSTYYCLSILPVAHASKILLQRYQVINGDQERSWEVNIILRRLSVLGYFDNSTILHNIDERHARENVSPILRILSTNTISGFTTLIRERLDSGSYSEKLLAITACALNGDHYLCDRLIEFLTEDNRSLRDRAIHAICIQGNAEQQFHLLTWFEKNAFEANVAIKILNTITPQGDQNYEPLIKLLERFIKQKRGPFVDDEILAEVFSLHDNLSIISCARQRDAYLSITEEHTQDYTLSKEIAAYPSYSETIKIILRNAELTWQHSELFNNLVDKSTMLVQYSKSTDLLLQQRLGYRLFHNPEVDYLPLFQGRIMELGLDSDSYSHAKMIRHLRLEGFFTTKEFPGHRLKTLAESIMSGKIMTDRFRAIDGLRAWSLMLLLFARTFVVKNTKMLPILPMRRSGEEKINGIVKLMNKFQDLRNNAAHHGVLVEPDEISEIRADSFKLLNELEEVLGD